MADESLYIWLNRNDETVRNFASYRRFFECLRASFLPAPARLTVGNRKPTDISGYDAPALMKALDRAKDNLTLSSADESLKTLLWPLKDRTAISIYFNPGTTEQNRTLFVDLAESIEPTYGRCHFYAAMKELNATHYSRSRTFYASGLYWLNFFGPDEEARQGGPALERNPFVRAQRFPHGLLLEVCESPWEAITPEGVQRLIQATESMPPLPEQAAEPKPPAPQAQRFRIPAEQLKIAGFSGFYDRMTRVFWITENLVPPSILDRTTQEGIHRIRDSKEPAVSGVRVLFSTREAAELNKDLLQGLEAEAWYVSAVTGKPQRA